MFWYRQNVRSFCDNLLATKRSLIPPFRTNVYIAVQTVMIKTDRLWNQHGEKQYKRLNE